MQQNKQNSFKNYYKMSDEELDSYIAKIRDWLFDYPNHKNYKRVSQALDIALDAKSLREEKNEFGSLIMDKLT